MDLKLTADLEGLAAGVVKIAGKAAGSVLVRNPKFSLAFTHPRTVRSQEPYAASVTILNTGLGAANFVRVTLPAAALSGAALESDATVELGDILPGESATARWKLRDLLRAFPIVAKLEMEMFARLLGTAVRREESSVSGLYCATFFCGNGAASV